MKERNWLGILGAALLVSAAFFLFTTNRTAASQTSASHTTTKKKSRRSVSSRSRRRSRPKGQTAPTSDRIKEIQAALQREGVYNAEPTGKWDDTTAAAMRAYQDKNGLSPTGKIDALSLEKLGLGARTAGKAAPVLPATAVPGAAPIASTPAGSPPAAADPPAK